MRKLLLSLVMISASVAVLAQSSAQYPDSAKNVVAGGTAWSITNPLNHTGTVFTNAPVITCINCSSDRLQLYSCGFSIPGTASVTGVEMIYGRGGCNAGAFMQESIGLLVGGSIIGTPKSFTVSAAAQIDTMGSSSDLWGTSLTPAQVNANDFGTYFMSRSSGICTYQIGTVEIIVYYSTVTGIIESQSRKVQLYPNPVKSQLVVTGVNPSSEYAVYDLTGRTILTGKTPSSKINIDATPMKPGIYFLKIQGREEVEKFIVE